MKPIPSNLVSASVFPWQSINRGVLRNCTVKYGVEYRDHGRVVSDDLTRGGNTGERRHCCAGRASLLRVAMMSNFSEVLPALSTKMFIVLAENTLPIQRRRRISKPAAIASTASTVVTVVETRILSNGSSPVRINQIASKIIPRFLPARVLGIANVFLLLSDVIGFDFVKSADVRGDF